MISLSNGSDVNALMEHRERTASETFIRNVIKFHLKNPLANEGSMYSPKLYNKFSGQPLEIKNQLTPYMSLVKTLCCISFKLLAFRLATTIFEISLNAVKLLTTFMPSKYGFSISGS